MHGRAVLLVLAVSLWGNAPMAEEAKIVVHADRGQSPHHMTGACIEDVNHEIYGDISTSQLGKAFAQYMNEYGGYMPSTVGTPPFGWGKGPGWEDKLFPYLDSNADGKGPSYPENAYSERTAVFRCPSLKYYAGDRRIYFSGYFINCRLYLDSVTGGFDLARLKYPSKVIALYDRNKWTMNPHAADPDDICGNSRGPDGYGPGALWRALSGGPDFSGPHARGYNILFADWHVSWFNHWDKGKMTRHAEQ